MMNTAENTCCAEAGTPDCCAKAPAGTEMSFSLRATLKHPASAVWEALCDWEGHAAWVPLTTVETMSDNPNAFVAYTGVKPLCLEDNMRVVTHDDTSMHCVVEKIGPVLLGTAAFTVTPISDSSCTVEWTEHLRLVRGPKPLRTLLKLTAAPAKAGFILALRKLDRVLERTSAA